MTTSAINALDPATPAATWTTLRSGDFGIRVLGTAPRAGDVVYVTAKSGNVRPVLVARVLWTGDDRKTGLPVSLCAIAQATRSASTPTRAPSTPSATPVATATPSGSRKWRGARKPSGGGSTATPAPIDVQADDVQSPGVGTDFGWEF